MTDLNRVTKLVTDSLTLLGQADERSQDLADKALENVQEALDELRGGKVFAPHVDAPLTDALNGLTVMLKAGTLDRMEQVCVALRLAQNELASLLPPTKVAA